MEWYYWLSGEDPGPGDEANCGEACDHVIAEEGVGSEEKSREEDKEADVPCGRYLAKAFGLHASESGGDGLPSPLQFSNC